MLPARPLWGRDDAQVLHTAAGLVYSPVVESGSSVSVSLGLSASVSSAYRAPTPGYVIALPPITPLPVTVAASALVSLKVTVGLAVATTAEAPALTLGITAAPVTVVASAVIGGVRLVITPDAV